MAKKVSAFSVTIISNGANFISENRNRMQLMRYGVSVNFRIGELKAGVKKAERTINNDDTKSGGNNS